MLNATISTYGGPYSDSEPVEDPTTQIASDEFNRMLEDHAQTTRGAMRAWVSFATDIAPVLPPPAPPVQPPVIDATSVWGDGSAQHPVITKTAHGTYEIEYATTYQDELGFDEPVSLRFGGGNVADAAPADVHVVKSSGQKVTVYVYDLGFGIPPPLSDLGGGVEIQVWLR
ncbi:MAG: hypothetical protein KKC50_08355 [Candidatus Omnitrophica bacterium]|nr:hypothetical protein [Candidatus Omnitrophota bacterium]